MEDRHTVKAIVRQVTKSGARLDVGGTEVPWPKEALPDDIQEGEEVTLRLLTKETEAAERHEYARTLLTEILGGGHS